MSTSSPSPPSRPLCPSVPFGRRGCRREGPSSSATSTSCRRVCSFYLSFVLLSGERLWLHLSRPTPRRRDNYLSTPRRRPVVRPLPGLRVYYGHIPTPKPTPRQLPRPGVDHPHQCAGKVPTLAGVWINFFPDVSRGLTRSLSSMSVFCSPVVSQTQPASSSLYRRTSREELHLWCLRFSPHLFPSRVLHSDRYRAPSLPSVARPLTPVSPADVLPDPLHFRPPHLRVLYRVPQEIDGNRDLCKRWRRLLCPP